MTDNENKGEGSGKLIQTSTRNCRALKVMFQTLQILQRKKENIHPDNTVVALQSQLSHFSLSCCSGFGWSRVNYLHTGQCECMFSVCAEHSNDNRDIFIFSDQTVSLSRAKAFSVFCPATLMRKLRLQEKLKGDIVWTGGHNQPKSSSRLFFIMLSIQSGKKKKGETFDFPSHF